MRWRRVKRAALVAGCVVPGLGMICGDELGKGKYRPPPDRLLVTEVVGNQPVRDYEVIGTNGTVTGRWVWAARGIDCPDVGKIIIRNERTGVTVEYPIDATGSISGELP